MEVTLKEASLLCRKSEKTLRRKIDAGLLEGRKEPLEFGGFMWLIEIESLEELYPGSKPSQLPQVYNSPEPPQVRLRTRAIADDSLEGLPITNGLVPDGSELCDDDDDEDNEEWGVRQSFLNYILEENRGLKLEIRERDARILGLNERAMVLERALGEQEGKATTQARVLEWFQSQESEREKARGENERKLLEAGSVAAPAPTRAPYVAGVVGAVTTALLLLAFFASGLITFQ